MATSRRNSFSLDIGWDFPDLFDQFHHPSLLIEPSDNYDCRYTCTGVYIYNHDDQCAPVPDKLLKHTPNNYDYDRMVMLLCRENSDLPTKQPCEKMAVPTFLLYTHTS